MKTSLHHLAVFSLSWLALTSGGASAQQKSVLRFSDPNAPGRVVVRIGAGDLTVVAHDAPEITVQSDDADDNDSAERDDGLRRLDSDNVYLAKEAENVVTVLFNNAAGKPRLGDDPEVRLTVPRAANVTIERMGAGDTMVENVEGDLEARLVRGDLVIENAGGGVLVNSMNGDVEATFAALAANKPVSITTLRGDVELRVPSRAGANVRFRAHRGEILTDFPEGQLESHFENTDESVAAMAWKMKGADGWMSEVAEVRRVEMGVEKIVTEQVGAQAEAAASAMAEVSVTVEAGDAKPRAPRPSRSVRVSAVPVPPMPPMPPMPPLGGGKLVVGTLNGGGPDVIVSTAMGDIVLRKLE